MWRDSHALPQSFRCRKYFYFIINKGKEKPFQSMFFPQSHRTETSLPPRHCSEWMIGAIYSVSTHCPCWNRLHRALWCLSPRVAGGGVGGSCQGWPRAPCMTQHRPRVFIKMGQGGGQEQERTGEREEAELLIPPGHNQQLTQDPCRVGSWGMYQKRAWGESSKRYAV